MPETPPRRASPDDAVREFWWLHRAPQSVKASLSAKRFFELARILSPSKFRNARNLPDKNDTESRRGNRGIFIHLMRQVRVCSRHENQARARLWNHVLLMQRGILGCDGRSILSRPAGSSVARRPRPGTGDSFRDLAIFSHGRGNASSLRRRGDGGVAEKQRRGGKLGDIPGVCFARLIHPADPKNGEGWLVKSRAGVGETPAQTCPIYLSSMDH
ncbi:hypothetical protein DBV15_03352 [Temnothorax longispinosus]|uniref:Uncharacterized protein n=1 Tax=Temnothorax longispinosus TaxID=300112 RepID=A0A4S2JS97_9HYME|nr:hypothetical protein DBV15_03352 [Temnothorax longispinosus]